MKKRRQGALPAYFATATSTAYAEGNPSDAGELVQAALTSFDRHELTAMMVILAVIVFASMTAIVLMRTRIQANRTQAASHRAILDLKSELDRARALLVSQSQVLIQWDETGGRPEIMGNLSAIVGVSIREDGPAFSEWLAPEIAGAMQARIDELRHSGERFRLTLCTITNQQIEAEGQAVGGRAVLKLESLHGVEHDRAALARRCDEADAERQVLRSLLNALPHPIWSRNASGDLTFVNDFYTHAVEATSMIDAVANARELLDRASRERANRLLLEGGSFRERLPVIVAGKRKPFDVTETAMPYGRAGIGIDASEIESLRAELTHVVEAHRRTLDQMTAAIAVFSHDRRLTFHNAAYVTLWNLDPEFLAQQPTDSVILERLRLSRKLPEQADFKQWKTQLFDAYRALEPKDHWWHLPDGRTLRVVTAPNPEGGITYVFDDVTERLDLERRFDSLIRVQGETLDHLSEAVAVFASDGRLRLCNPAFLNMWRLPETALLERPHIEDVMTRSSQNETELSNWQSLRETVTSLDIREPFHSRFERADGNVLDCATVPLPDGGTLLTFQDVTDSMNVERALRERNEALEMADELKNDFVHHVSYELRSPLTNIIGFAQLLDNATAGPLTLKQREYLSYISASSSALLAIINDILDLATIDAGAMTLDLSEVDIRPIMEAAAEGIRDRLVESGVRLHIHADKNVGTFKADERRIRQILYNLLSNAVGFSPPNGVIEFRAERRPDAIIITVIDEGPGIPEEIVARVFNRFETHTMGTPHRGAGLGLSIVRSFVELHSGSVRIDSAAEAAMAGGTRVTCIFPLALSREQQAAE